MSEQGEQRYIRALRAEAAEILNEQIEAKKAAKLHPVCYAGSEWALNHLDTLDDDQVPEYVESLRVFASPLDTSEQE